MEKIGIFVVGHFTVDVTFFLPTHLSQPSYQEDNIAAKQNTQGNKNKVTKEKTRFQRQKEGMQAMGKLRFSLVTGGTCSCRSERWP